MVRNEEGALDCLAHALEGKIRQTCTMHDEVYSQSRFGHLINENNDGIKVIQIRYLNASYTTTYYKCLECLGETKKVTIEQVRNNLLVAFRYLIYTTLDEMKKALPLVLPQVPDHRRVIYTIYEYAPLLGKNLLKLTIKDCLI